MCIGRHKGHCIVKPAGGQNWARKTLALASWQASSEGSVPSRPDRQAPRRNALGTGACSSSARCCASMSAMCTGRSRSMRSTCCSAVCGATRHPGGVVRVREGHGHGPRPSACECVGTPQLGMLVELGVQGTPVHVCEEGPQEGGAVGASLRELLPVLAAQRGVLGRLRGCATARRLGCALRFSSSGLSAVNTCLRGLAAPAG